MKKYIIPVLALALLCSCAKEEVTEQETPEQTQKEELAQEAEEFVPGSAIVQFDDDMIALIESDLAKGKVVTKSMALNEALDELGITSITRVFPDAGEFEPRSRAFGMHRFYYVKYNTDVTKTKAEETLEHLPGIVTFEPDRKIRTEDATLFNDPYYSNQWQYDNKGNQSGYKAGADIDVVPVWQNYTTGSPNVIVSEVDGGVDYTHEDLAWNVNVDSSYCFVDGYEGRTIYPHAHGTHVAGSIVAVNNNGIGVCGVAGGNYAAKKKGARLESCQIFMDNPAGGDDLGDNSAAAVKWGADHGAVISQNSWGYVYKTEEAAKSGGIGSAMKAAVDYFNTYAGYNSQGVQVGPMAGGIVIFAAGNDGYSIGWPAAYEGIMAVGAIGVGGTRASYSNYGDWVDIAAPGGSSSSTTIYSTEPGNKYGYMMGTSMACPHVSGVAALVVSACGGAGFTREMLWNKLIKGANSDFLKSSNEIGPLVDALGAVSYGSSATQNPVTTMTASTKSNNVIFNWKVNRDSENHPAYGYRLLASKDKAALAAADPANPGSSISFTDVLTGEAIAGDAISGTLAGLGFSTQYYVAIAAFGYFRSFSKISVIETVTTGVNNPPVITTSYKGDFQIHSHETINFPFTITEPDGQTLTTSYVKGSDAESSYTDPTTGEFVVTVKGNAVDPGVYTAKLTASDPYGMSTVYNLKYTILENHAPVVVKKIGNMIMTTEGQKFTINMNQYIQDPDGEILTYTMAMSDKTVVHLNPQDSILYGTLLTYGMTTVTITASDARKASCQESFMILGRDPDVTVQLYPNPVSTTLYVRTGNDETQTYVKVVAPTGAIVYEATSTASAFNPVEVDMSKCAPGSYSVTVKYDDISVSKTVVKI